MQVGTDLASRCRYRSVGMATLLRPKFTTGPRREAYRASRPKSCWFGRRVPDLCRAAEAGTGRGFRDIVGEA